MNLSMRVAGVLAAGVVMSAPALASESMAKDAGCLACHDMSRKKAGPSIKDIAAKFKGQAGAVDTLAASIKAGKGHPASKASEADLKAIVGWMLQQ